MLFSFSIFDSLSKQLFILRHARLSYFWFLMMNYIEAIIFKEYLKCVIILILALFHFLLFCMNRWFTKNKRLHFIDECLCLIGYGTILFFFWKRLEDQQLEWNNHCFFLLFNVFYGQTIVFKFLSYKLTKIVLLTSFLLMVVWKIDIEIYYKFFVLISTFLSCRSTNHKIDTNSNFQAYESDEFAIFPDNQDLIFEIDKNFSLKDLNKIFLEKHLRNINQSKKKFLSSIKRRNVILKAIIPFIPKKENEFQINIELAKNLNNYNEEISVENLLDKLFSIKEKECFCIAETTNSEDQIKSVLFLKTYEKVYIKLKFENFIVKERENSEKADQYSKTIFFIAHELRTPLNCILNSLQLLKEIVNEEDIQHKFIAPALISSKFMINLINNYLDVSQIQTDSLVLMPVEFDVHELIEETKELFSFQAKQRGIKISLIVDSKVLKAKSDKERIRQIIINLLSKKNEKFLDIVQLIIYFL